MMEIVWSIAFSVERNRGFGFRGFSWDGDALDLLRRMLTVDHGMRITGREALQHPFFGPLWK
jgi:serine/threonine protein kinase